jgi:hypothetical protein
MTIGGPLGDMPMKREKERLLFCTDQRIKDRNEIRTATNAATLP